MAAARKRFEGELTCYLIAWIPRAVWENKPIDPDAINPWTAPPPPPSPEMERLAKWQAKTAWRAMIMGLSAGGRKTETD